MTDALAPFGQVVLAIRWGITAISVALAAPELQDGDARIGSWTLALVSYTAYRTWRPLWYERPMASMATVVAEVGATALAVALTGHWESPLVFSILAPIAIAGFARGFGFALRLAVTGVLAVSIAWSVVDDPADDKPRRSAEWGGEVVLVALVAGYARRISGEADERRVQALDRLGRLNDANVLLFQLHQVTQTLPASLDLDEVLDTTLEQVRALFDTTAAAVLLSDNGDERWHTVRRSGGPPAGSYLAAELPPPLARADRLRSAVKEDDLATSGGEGLDPRARSGLYAVLAARDRTIGMVSLEHDSPGHFTDRDVELLAGFVDPVALAVDNARWFERLRTVGAAEERTRIAKELHDRIGQSLAYVAFELDRLTKKAGGGTDLTAPLDALRGDVRGVIGELRDTLYDLRTEVTEAEGLASVLHRFLERVEARSHIPTQVRIDESARLPIMQEREVFRIAQEVVAQVERHGRAARVLVDWRSDGRSGELAITHAQPDGDRLATWIGADELAGLRERASSIGATIVVDHEHAGGPQVRCTVTGR